MASMPIPAQPDLPICSDTCYKHGKLPGREERIKLIKFDCSVRNVGRVLSRIRYYLVYNAQREVLVKNAERKWFKLAVVSELSATARSGRSVQTHKYLEGAQNSEGNSIT